MKKFVELNSSWSRNVKKKLTSSSKNKWPKNRRKRGCKKLLNKNIKDSRRRRWDSRNSQTKRPRGGRKNKMRRGLGNKGSMMKSESGRSDSKMRRGALMKKNRDGWLTLLPKRRRNAKLLRKNRRKSNSKCKNLRKLDSNVSKRKKGFAKWDLRKNRNSSRREWNSKRIAWKRSENSMSSEKKMRREDLLRKRRPLNSSGSEMRSFLKKNRIGLSRQLSFFLKKGLRRNKTRQRKLLHSWKSKGKKPFKMSSKGKKLLLLLRNKKRKRECRPRFN